MKIMNVTATLCIAASLAGSLSAQINYANGIPIGNSAVVSESASGSVIGLTSSGILPVQTSRWDGSAWVSVAATGPQSRQLAALAGELGGGVVMIGGEDLVGGGLLPNLTWVWDAPTNSWSSSGLIPSPSMRRGVSAAQAGQGLVTVLFGGVDGSSTMLNDTWTFNGTAWTQILGLPTSPSPRAFAAMAPDGNGNVLLFGGLDSVGNFLNDTWLFSTATSTWAQLTPVTVPNGRILHGLALINEPAIPTSASRSEVLMIGGVTNLGPGVTYAFRFGNWVQVVGLPSAFINGAATGATDFNRREAIFVELAGVEAIVTGRFGFTNYGAGCPCVGAGAPMTMGFGVAPGQSPQIGNTVSLSVTNGVPSGVAFLLFDVGAAPGIGPIGPPWPAICMQWLLGSPSLGSVALPLNGLGNSAGLPFTIPNVSSNIGALIYYQAVDAGAVCASDGLEMRVGR